MDSWYLSKDSIGLDNIEKCLVTSGCAITTDALDLYDNYKTLQESKMGEKLKES